MTASAAVGPLFAWNQEIVYNTVAVIGLISIFPLCGFIKGHPTYNCNHKIEKKSQNPFATSRAVRLSTFCSILMNTYGRNFPYLDGF
jgi:hypothetical protein